MRQIEILVTLFYHYLNPRHGRMRFLRDSKASRRLGAEIGLKYHEAIAPSTEVAYHGGEAGPRPSLNVCYFLGFVFADAWYYYLGLPGGKFRTIYSIYYNCNTREDTSLREVLDRCLDDVIPYRDERSEKHKGDRPAVDALVSLCCVLVRSRKLANQLWVLRDLSAPSDD